MQVGDEARTILEQENALIERLLELAQAKRSVINKAEEVARIAGWEQEILNELRPLEERRHQVFDIIAPGLTLEQWLAQSPEEDGPLQMAARRLKESYLQLRTVNELNIQLMQESLALVQFSLGLLVGDDPKTYARRGTKNSGKSFFDRKV